jgi:hypothetical protein
VTTPNTERRRFTRIDFDARTELQQGDHIYEVTLIDISFNGILIKSARPLNLSLGEEAFATIHLQGDNLSIRTPVSLTHKHEDEYGFLIENLDLDSLTLLRRLVELNLGEPSLLERELDHLFTTETD